MREVIGVEAGGERLSLTLQTLEIHSHSSLSDHPKLVKEILQEAGAKLVLLLNQKRTEKA